MAARRNLCIIILSIWSWSLLQFTLVLTQKVQSKKSKVKLQEKKKGCLYNTTKVCCSVDVWSVLINIILQDAPFFIFRLLLIVYFEIISYMNIFFTCKNTLVIVLQFYRLIVVQAEKRKGLKNVKAQPLLKKSARSSTSHKRLPPPSPPDTPKSVRNPKSSRNSRSPSSKTVKSPKRSVARLVRNVSEDDNTVASFLLHSENESPWRQSTRVSHF